jgi:radical SAM superfamily enzyme with C-terminal helix-hairpin-helix motif
LADSRAGPGDQNDESSPVKPNSVSNYFFNIANKTINIAIIHIKNLNPREASEYATSNACQLLLSARRRWSSEVMHFHYEGHWGT